MKKYALQEQGNTKKKHLTKKKEQIKRSGFSQKVVTIIKEEISSCFVENKVSDIEQITRL